MYIVFRDTKRDEKDDLADSTVKILYSVFLGAILIGIAIIALLRVPDPASGVKMAKKEPIKTMSKRRRYLITNVCRNNVQTIVHEKNVGDGIRLCVCRC